MKQNVGKIDRIVRVVAGVGLLSLFFILEGDLHWIGLIGLVPLATAAMGWCPMYCPLKISTVCVGEGGKSCCGGGACKTRDAPKE
ncbi:MAG: DUF2892 domain-containing protein [Alphaproteobacteria bacterium]|nr:DUF2892 domain-containing protein [Alphaproteobacteria bacterium]MCB9985307.1 DUF2892 domain-containing protein [Micavibrio sp.]HPQ51216.1 DUF2892 domain-containing protein [Alphaproteobacteria bacterium]